jgi:glycosyltransferase involved in cell wall biosynthesis
VHLELLGARFSFGSCPFLDNADIETAMKGTAACTLCALLGCALAYESITWIHVDTWLGVPHSYAFVGTEMAQALQDMTFLKKLRVTIGESQSLYKASWGVKEILKSAVFETGIKQYDISQPHTLCPDIIFRAAFPFNFSKPAHCSNTVLLLHATSETGRLWDIMQHTDSFIPWHNLSQQALVGVVTPSEWSRAGFSRAGVQTHLVQHGFGKHIHPTDDIQRRQARKVLGLPLDCIVLLTVGAVTPNKGVHHLLDALGQALAPTAGSTMMCVTLVVKAPSAVYEAAEQRLRQAVNATGKHSYSVLFHGATLSAPSMALLYSAADAYVTPYSAEGFNLPALEAAATGLPVLATGAGPVPEFLHDSIARFIRASVVTVPGDPALFPHTCPQGGQCATLQYAQIHMPHLVALLQELLAGLLQLRTTHVSPQTAPSPPSNGGQFADSGAVVQCAFSASACSLCQGNGSCVSSSAAWLRGVPLSARTDLRHLTWGAAAKKLLAVADTIRRGGATKLQAEAEVAR